MHTNQCFLELLPCHSKVSICGTFVKDLGSSVKVDGIGVNPFGEFT